MSGPLFDFLFRTPRRRRRVNFVTAHETLESRRLLAVGNDVPSIQGTVFVDLNDNDQFDSGEGVSGATVRLILDDGDGVYETNGEDVQFGADEVTDADGDYCFDGIDSNDNYFVLQIQQNVGGLELDEQVSALQLPGTPNLVIDTFDTNQEVVANSPAPSSAGGSLSFADETEVLGGERDILAELLAGVGEVEVIVNPFNLLPVMQYNSSSGVEGRAVVTWDGSDADASETPSMGLGGRDLTQGGINTGIAMDLGIDDAGSGNAVMLRLYQGDASNVSTATSIIPVTDGSAAGFLFVPFSDFSGPVSPDNVDAVQLVVGQAGIPSADGQIDTIGVLGPKTANFANDPTVDLAITKSNTTDTVIPGGSISYTITVENLGPIDIDGATIQDTIPAEILNSTFNSNATGNATGNTAQGSGDISDTVNMPVGSTIVYTVSGTVDPSATGSILNTAIVAPPDNVTDTVSTNNDDNESDTLTPTVDLAITKDDGVTQVQPNDTITYAIVVSNLGPSDVTGATVVDSFPAELINVSYSSSANGTASGHTNGTGNINDTVNISAGSSISYTVTATVAGSASGTVANTASVTAPTGTVESDNANNSDNDIDAILPTVDLTVTKTDNETEVQIGQVLTYLVTVGNSGPSDVSGASFVDNFPAELTNVSYTSAPSGGATGNSASGNNDLDEILNLPAGSSVTYTVTATVADDVTGTISNTATVTAPAAAIETDDTNNSATDTDAVTPEFDISVTKTDNVDSVLVGGETTYAIVVANSGPAAANGVVVEDLLPSEISSATYTSVAANGASGNSDGVGDINDTVNLPAGSSVNYSLLATVDNDATGQLTNQVTVTPPAGTIDRIDTNNVAIDTDTLTLQPALISGFTYVDGNGDGSFGSNEAPLQGIAIQLLQDNVILEEVFTDNTGAYQFSDLAPGTYTVTQTQSDRYNDGLESITGDLGEIVGNDEFLVTVASGDEATGLNFGELSRQPSKRSLLSSAFRGVNV